MVRDPDDWDGMMDEQLPDDDSDIMVAEDAAEQRLEDAIMEDDDMTGQDNEERIEHRAADLIAARDRALQRRDPEGYAERRAMGCL